MEFLTIRETAKLLKCGVSTAYLMAQRGAIPCVHFGSLVRVPKVELERLIAERTTGVVRRGDGDAA